MSAIQNMHDVKSERVDAPVANTRCRLPLMKHLAATRLKIATLGERRCLKYRWRKSVFLNKRCFLQTASRRR
ncbi:MULTISPECIES: hypothetical protein, partial [Pseudomonas syringae group genomosp. 2]|uniref:hypothetical protein n=1 Tax=Pseudomonas syringae group genomosp. 2 TaxID=251698 RepID=UPI001E3ACB69